MATIPITSTASSVAPSAESQPVSRFALTNRGGTTLCVPIINQKTGEMQEVFVQPGGQPKIAPGFTVDPVFVARNPDMQAVKIS